MIYNYTKTHFNSEFKVVEKITCDFNKIINKGKII